MALNGLIRMCAEVLRTYSLTHSLTHDARECSVIPSKPTTLV